MSIKFTRNLLLIAFSALLSCAGPKTVVIYEGTSRISRSNFDADAIKTDTNNDTIISVVPALPRLLEGKKKLEELIHYPARALKEQIKGIATIQFVIDPDGNTSEFHVLEENPQGYGFADEIMEALKQLKYKNTAKKRFLWVISIEFKL